MKYYDKFYEIDNNRYYTITADDDLYIATESVLKIGKSFLLHRPKYLTQGFKLLKISSPIASLFSVVSELKPKKGQDTEFEDMIRYEGISNSKLKSLIEANYNIVFDEQKKLLKAYYEDAFKKCEEDKYNGVLNDKECMNKMVALETRMNNDLRTIDRNNPLKNGSITLTSPEYVGDLMLRGLMAKGLKHLFTEKVTTFVSNVYLYELDCFGTLTIYRVVTIKNVAKTIDTFIYDRKLIKKFLNHVYENDKEEK